MPCLESTATAGWNPVSIRIGPADGCSTRKAITGISSHSSRGTRTPIAFRAASRPSSRWNIAGGPIIRAHSSGCSFTVAPSLPPGSGSEAGRGSAAVAMAQPYAAIGSRRHAVQALRP